MTYLVIMVAGMSSRFGGNPKQMAIIGPNNETLIEYSINQAIKNPFTKIVFITNPKTEYLFVNIFGNIYKNIAVVYIQQQYDITKRVRPWGTGDAISNLYPYFLKEEKENLNFILINGDDIYGEQTFQEGYSFLNSNYIQSKNASIIGGLLVKDTMPKSGKVNRGIISIDGDSVISLDERLNISREENPELMDQLANINFIGLQLKDLEYVYNINKKFKEENINDPKIESNLTIILNQLISTNCIQLKYFYIKNKIVGITNPGDEVILKNSL